MEKLTRSVLLKPWSVIALFLLFAWVLSIRLPELGFDPSYQTFFDADNPDLVDFEAIRDTFADSDTLLFLLVAADGDLLTAEKLAVVAELTDAAWSLPNAIRVDSVANFIDVSSDGASLDVGELLPDPDEITASQVARIRQLLQSEPFLRGRLLAADGGAAAVQVAFLSDADPLTNGLQIESASRALAERFEGRAGLSVHRTGIAVMNHAFAKATLQDGQWLYAIMAALIIGSLWLLMNSVVAVIAVLACVAFAVLGGIGASAWLNMTLTTPSAVAPLIIITIAIADAVHLLLGYHAARAAGCSHRDGWSRSVDENLEPVVWTTITTAIGFLSLNFSEVPPFRDLGTMAAIGALLAGAASLTLLPALLSVAPDRQVRPRLPASLLAGLFRWVLARPGTVLVSGGVVALVALAGLLAVRLNDDFVGFFSKGSQFRQATELAQRHLGGVHEIEYLLSASGPGGVNDPDYVRDVERFADWLRAQDEVRHVTAWSDLIKRINRAVHEDDPVWQRVPAQRDEILDLSLLLQLGLPPERGIGNLISADAGSTRLVVAFEDLPSNAFLAVEARIDDWLQANLPGLDQRHGSINLLFSRVSQRNVTSMLLGHLLAVALIGVLLALALRSASLAALSLVTNLLPVLMALGLWGMLLGDVGLAVSSAIGLTLGIVVDDTVHLLARYRRARAESDRSAGAALAAAFESAGPALVLTTLVLACGFLVLTFSGFRVNAHLGAITALTILVALAVDLLMLPALLLVLTRRNGNWRRRGRPRVGTRPATSDLPD